MAREIQRIVLDQGIGPVNLPGNHDRIVVFRPQRQKNSWHGNAVRVRLKRQLRENETGKNVHEEERVTHSCLECVLRYNEPRGKKWRRRVEDKKTVV